MATVRTKTDLASYENGVPPLEAGDRLSRPEFERRYGAMQTDKKAELLDGVVYIPSPVRVHRHGQPHARLLAWLVLYEAATSDVIVADNASTRLDLDNEPHSPTRSSFWKPPRAVRPESHPTTMSRVHLNWWPRSPRAASATTSM